MYALIFIFILPLEPIAHFGGTFQTEEKCNAKAESQTYQFPTIHVCVPEEVFGKKV